MAAQQPQQHNINPNLEIPFYYEFLVEDTIPKEAKPAIMGLLDAKIKAARKFLDYLNSIDRNSEGGDTRNENYYQVQTDLSVPIVDGKTFAKLNKDYNHATFEVEDTKSFKKKGADESLKAVTTAETSKKRFHEATKILEGKAGQINYSNIGSIPYIKEDAVRYHFEKVCAWILDIYYDTPASKFEWDNFKKNVFLEDKGADFSKRIKGLYVPKLYDYQIETCQYISKTRPLFMSKLNNKDFDLLLSTSEDVIVAFNARQEYTLAKKTIAKNRSKDIEYNIDLGQAEKVSKSTQPYIETVYSKLADLENKFRVNNMSDFLPDNRAEHLFYRGAGGKVTTFLRGDALFHYGDTEDDIKAKKADKKLEKKPDKGYTKAPEQSLPNGDNRGQGRGPIDANDVRLGDRDTAAEQQNRQDVRTQKINKGGEDIEFDDSFEMPKVD